MRGVVVDGFGDATKLVCRDLPDPVPQPGQAMVEVEAAGIGRSDVLMRLGLYPGLDRPGFVPGVDVAGVVREVGAAADRSWIGRRVLAVVDRGAHAELALAGVNRLVEIPAALGSTEAAALGVAAVTAVVALRGARIEAGSRVLVTGASGGLGSAAVGWAVHCGAEVVAITSGDPDRLAATAGVEVRGSVAGLDGWADIVIDPVAGPAGTQLVGVLAPGGRLVVCGVAGGLPDPALVGALLARFADSPQLLMTSLRSSADHELAAAGSAVLRAAAGGRLRPLVHAAVGLDGVVEAHRSIERREVVGRMVVCP